MLEMMIKTMFAIVSMMRITTSRNFVKPKRCRKTAISKSLKTL